MDLVFDDRQLLLPGVHETTLEIVKETFGRFQRSDRRLKLFARLTDYIEELKKAEVGESLVIDGSFVMSCVDEPGDIDLVLVLPAGWDIQAELKPYQYNLVSKGRIRASHGFDLFVVLTGSAEETGWINFFGQVATKWSERFDWPTGLRKGMLRVRI